MDVFVEQIIKKKFGPKDYLFFLLVLLAGMVIMCAALFYIPHFFPLLLIVVFALAYYLISSRNLEFEYSVTNGDITIDKIINRRKRKHIISADARNIEKMGKYNPEEHKNKNYSKRIFVSINDSGQGGWYISLRHSELGNVLVVFDPDERVLNAIKPFISRQVSMDAFGRN